MTQNAAISVADLAKIYAGYFAQDFRNSVLHHLSGTFPTDLSVIDKAVPTSTQGLDLTGMNPVTHFIFENASYVIEHDLENPESRETWDMVKELPSAHHESIDQVIFATAAFYEKVVDEIAINTIAVDAETAYKTIATTIADRTAQETTGGVVHLFNWGLLDDGLWLNNALRIAFDKLRIFRPGEQPVLYWAQQAFKQAKIHAREAIVDHASDEEFHMVVAHGDDRVLSSVSVSPDDITLHRAVHNVGSLENRVEYWEKGMRDPKIMIEAIRELSNLVVTTSHLSTVHGNMESDVVGPAVGSRLSEIQTTAMYCLIAFQALRDSKFADKIILMVNRPTQDPIVDVYVNKDLLNSFMAAGGSESDLSVLGTYINQNGMSETNVGFSVEWAIKRKDSASQAVLAQEEQRLEQLRRNDAAVIRNVTVEVLTRLVQSYVDGYGLDQTVGQFARDVQAIAKGITSDQPGYNAMLEIARLLAKINGDSGVIITTDVLLNSLGDDDLKAHARPIAVAHGAMSEVSKMLA